MLLAAAAESPWYGTPLIAGGFLIIGGLIATASSLLTKRQELQRADRALWDQEILDVSVQIIEECWKLKHATVAEDGSPAGTQNEQARHSQAFLDAIGPKVHRLAFIASDNLVEALDALAEAALSAVHRTPPEGLNEQQDRLRAVYIPTVNEAVKRYMDAVRVEIRANR